jgi:hypothetical protein
MDATLEVVTQVGRRPVEAVVRPPHPLQVGTRGLVAVAVVHADVRRSGVQVPREPVGVEGLLGVLPLAPSTGVTHGPQAGTRVRGPGGVKRQ